MSVGKFVEAALAGRAVPLNGDGSVTRDFTYVDDIARGIVAAAEKLAPGSASGFELANLGGSERSSVRDMIALVEKHTGKKLELEKKPPAPGDAPTTWASVERAERLLGWRPQVKLDEGVARTVAWAKEARARHPAVYG